MFDLPEGETTPGPSKIKLIMAVLESILKEEGKNTLPKRDKSLLEEAVFSLYEKNPRPKLGDLKEMLQKHPSNQMNIYSKILYPWTQSIYGKFLNGQTNMDLSKDLITIEMKRLDAHPDLQNVLLLLFTDFIKKEAMTDLSQALSSSDR